MARSLDRAEQDELLRLAGRGDRPSQDKLVDAFMPTVVRLAEAVTDQGLPMGDLVQEGSIGLIEAIRSFSSSGEADFQRFAELRIARQLTAAIEAEAAAVKDEQLLVAAADDYARTELILRRTLQREPTEKELAEKLEWTLDRLRYVASVVEAARRRQDEELLAYLDPEALALEDGQSDSSSVIDPSLN